MYLTQTNYIRHLPKDQYEAILEMCAYSNNLYNVGLYQVRQHFFATHQYLRYEENYHLCKGNENYKLLQASISQQILRICDRSFRSFFALLNKKKSGGYDKKVHLPYYHAKGGKYLLVLPTNIVNIKNGYLTVPMSRAFARQHPELDHIRIPVPDRISGKHIAEVRIVPVLNGKSLKVQYCYEQEAEPHNLNADNILAIDIGLDNLASCVTTTGTSFIVDGRKLKSINQWYNKQLAHYASIKDHQDIKGFTARMNGITDKRNRKMTDYIQIPFDQRRTYLKCLCERYGIAYIETEESYTSKASFLDGNCIPVFDARNPYTGAFSGKRVKRGLYRTKENTLVNADINGACNIAKKGKQNLDIEGLRRGLLASPLRIRVV